MSELASRPAPARGRGSTRGRGGFRGGNRTRDRANGEVKDTPNTDETEQGELGEMKKKYSRQLSSLRELFADWKDVDLLFALQETDGDLERTIDHISEGNVSQFSSVKKKAKDRSRSKVPESSELSSRPTRGRGAADSARGGRGRSDRGRGVSRAGRGGSQHPNGARNATGPSTTAIESTSWDAPPVSADAGAWDTEPVATPKKLVAADAPKSFPVPAGPPKKTWASMFAKPTPPPQKPAVPEVAPPQDAGAVPSSDISSGYVEVTHSDVDLEPVPQSNDDVNIPDASEAAERPAIEVDDSAIELPPSKDKLTEDNVEHLPDSSQPAPVGTAASTVESSRGPDGTTASTAAQAQQAPIGRPALGGYATTAMKATSTQPRSASFQRRMMEQQEAVVVPVMPGNHALDRAAVQFGSLGLNGDADSLDVDEDREEAETRQQPPQHSPVAQPKTALPPPPRHEAAPQEPIQPKPAPGLPPVAQQQPIAQPASASPLVSQHLGQQTQSGQGFNQFGRYGQSTEAASQKPYDPFGQQTSQQSPFDSYPQQTQAPAQSQQPSTSQIGAFSSTSNDYAQYYTADQRAAYQNYYGGGYGQQNVTAPQETGTSQQRTGSAFGAGASESAFPSAQSQQQQQSRFGETQQSGHNTPNPTAATGQQHAAGGQTQQQMHQQGHGQAQAQGQAQHYPFNHPYYNQPYYTSYMNQYQQQYPQGNFAPFGKGGMYGQPHHGYGMGQTSYDQHGSTSAMAGSFGVRDGGLGSGLGSEYSRSGSAQPPQSQTTGAGAFGDVFGRSPGSFPGQTQQYGQQGVGQQQGDESSLKPFGKEPSGPSAGSLGQPGRPTSATNASNQAGQGGLPPPQSHQGFGGYQNQFGQMQGGQASQYGGLGGLGGHQATGQSHQAGGYGGGYGAGFGSGYQQQGAYGGRGGWSGNYQGH